MGNKLARQIFFLHFAQPQSTRPLFQDSDRTNNSDLKEVRLARPRSIEDKDVVGRTVQAKTRKDNEQTQIEVAANEEEPGGHAKQIHEVGRGDERQRIIDFTVYLLQIKHG